MMLNKKTVIKSILSLMLIGSFELFPAQQIAVSPFKLEDYKNFQEKYITYVKNNPQKAIQIGEEYYSPKKLDSLLLIKDKLKKEKLSLEYSDPKQIEEYYKREPDNIILPYAYFELKENDFLVRADQNRLFMSNKIWKCIWPILMDSEKLLRDIIFLRKSQI